MLRMLPVVALLACSCHRTLTASVTQPNPLGSPFETLRESEKLTIVTGDMELEMPRYQGADGERVMVKDRYPLRNTARFTVVSRDRLRFHVQLEHKWQEYVDVTGWRARLVDDQGRVFLPSDIDMTGDRHVVKMWDYETRTAVRNQWGDVVDTLDDGYKRRQSLGSLSVFRGRGDFVFYHRDLFSTKVQWLKLSLERDGMTFEFTWHFAEPDDGTDTHVASSR